MNTEQESHFDLLKDGHKIFYGVAAISLINTGFVYADVGFVLVFGLGFIDVLNVLGYYAESENLKMIYIAMSVLISVVYGLLGYLSQRGVKLICMLGLGIYLLDSISFIYFFDIIGGIAHLVVLKGLYDYYQAKFGS